MAPKCTFESGCSRAIIYKNDDSGAPRASRFCEKHTCIGFAGEDPCFRKVMKGGETRCIVHVQCKALFCTEPRMAAANGGWWDCCVNHKCKNNECMQLQHYYTAKEKYMKFCVKHKCVKIDCETEKVGSTRHCAAHTCTEDACNSIVEADDKLCSLHIQCKSKLCTRKRVLKGGHYQVYCSTHIVCEVPTCTKEKRKNSFYCINHTCFKRDCEIASGANFYCPEHTCVASECQNTKLYYLDNSNMPEKSSFCSTHECRKEGCHRPSRNGAFGFCQEHNCDKPDCNSLKLIDPGSPTPLLLCRKHYDESRSPPKEPPASKPAPTPAPPPAPAPSPGRSDLAIEALDAIKREQRNHRDKLDDIYSLIERRMFR